MRFLIVIVGENGLCLGDLGIARSDLGLKVFHVAFVQVALLDARKELRARLLKGPNNSHEAIASFRRLFLEISMESAVVLLFFFSRRATCAKSAVDHWHEQRL
jgi:hypothetical protein